MKRFIATFNLRIILFLIISLYYSLLTSCTGTGGALPQTSVPLPDNDPITISSPDSQGFVTVTGAANAVPDNAKLIVSVSSASSSLSLMDFYDFFFPQVMAATICTSDLPECPTLSNGSCQFDSNDDGSFLLQVPASVSDVVTINYLDADQACIEVEGFTQTVTSGITELEFSGVSIAIGSGIVFGTSASNPIIALINNQDGSVASSVTPTISGDPVRIDAFTDHNENKFLMMQTSSATYVASFDNDNLDENQQRKFVSDTSDTPISNLGFRAVDFLQFPPSSDHDCLSSDQGTSSLLQHRPNYLLQGGQTYTRLFMTNNKVLYILDSVDNYSVNSQSDSGNLIPREVALVLSDFPTAEVVAIPYIAVLDSTFVVVVGFSDGSSDSVTYYAVEINRDSGFCSSNLQLGSDIARIQLAVTSGSVFVSEFETVDENGNEIVKLGLLKISDQTIKFIDATNMELAETFSVTSLVEPYNSTGLNVSNVTQFLEISRSEGTVFEMFLLGGSSSGAGFVASDGSATQSGTGIVANAINPVGMVLDRNLNKILILDAGISGSGNSNLIIIDVGN